MKNKYIGSEESAGFGNQTKQTIGALLENNEIILSTVNPHVGRNMRNRYNLSREQLYTELGGAFAKNSIKNYENGLRPAPVKYLLTLAAYYNVSLESLIDHSPITKVNTEPILTKLYSYVNQESSISEPLEKIDYNILDSMDQNKYIYNYYILKEDDQTLNLPWGTRLLIRLKDKEPLKVLETEQIFMLRLDKQKQPIDDFVQRKVSKNNDTPKTTDQKVILTRARLVTDIKTAKYVLYYDGKRIKHMLYRDFIGLVDGVVEKIIFEQFLYQKHKNTLSGVFPRKNK